MLQRVFFIIAFLSAVTCYSVQKAPAPKTLDDVDTMLSDMEKEVGIGALPKQDKVVKQEAKADLAAPAPAAVAVFGSSPPPAKAAAVNVFAAPAKAPVVPAPAPAAAKTASAVPAPVPSVVPQATAPAAAAAATEGVAKKEEPKVVAKPKPKTKTAEDDDVPMYSFAYTPDDDYARDSNYSKSTPAGRPGNLVMTFNAEAVMYTGMNVGKLGIGGELGWQINIFKYMSIMLAMDGGYRRGVNAGDKLYSVGAKGVLRGRLLPWLYPFVEMGTECTKVADVGWQHASKVYGAGLLIRLGAADKKAEFEMYKLTRIQRIALILGFDYLKAAEQSVLIDTYVARLGMSLEF